MFPKSIHSYTATPFANVLINLEDDDSFPTTSYPFWVVDNYIGASGYSVRLVILEKSGASRAIDEQT